MATGTIASVRDKGFGFIASDGATGAQDLFFHRTAVHADGFDRLRVGQRVRYDDEADPRDPSRRRAVNVELVDADGAERPDDLA
jgi:cold shock protein